MVRGEKHGTSITITTVVNQDPETILQGIPELGILEHHTDPPKDGMEVECGVGEMRDPLHGYEEAMQEDEDSHGGDELMEL